MMDNCESGPGPKKQKCWSGGQGKESGKPMMAFTKKKKAKKEIPVKPEENNLHMNVRDLGGHPGDVRLAKSSSGSSYTAEQMAQGAANEKGMEKARIKFRRRKQ